MDERWLQDWEAAWVRVFEDEDSSPYEVGFISWAQISKVAGNRAEVMWMANMSTRFHAIKTDLPRKAFVACAEAFEYEKRPTVFVRREWFESLHARSHSTFAMIDASDFEAALRSDSITTADLIRLRDRIDELAIASPHVSFTSFADSLLLKTNWVVGSWDRPSEREYEPEDFVRLIDEIDQAYRAIIGVETYAVVAQGANEYYGDGLIHVSTSGNHVSLNSLGLPFAQIALIEAAARAAVKASIHPRAEMYLDRDFFLSLGVDDYDWRTALRTYPYQTKLAGTNGSYVCLDREELIRHLK